MCFTSLTLAALLMTGCTYGPVQQRVKLENMVVRPDTPQFALAAIHTRYREPSGLARFPDGGRQKIISQRGLLYVVDTETGNISQLTTVDPPSELANNFSVHINGWRDNTLYYSVTGCPGDDCYGEKRRRQHFSIAAGGTPERIGALPQTLEREPGMLTRAADEKVYLRLSRGRVEAPSGATVIRIRRSDDRPFEPAYRLSTSGSLVPLE